MDAVVHGYAMRVFEPATRISLEKVRTHIAVRLTFSFVGKLSFLDEPKAEAEQSTTYLTKFYSALYSKQLVMYAEMRF